MTAADQPPTDRSTYQQIRFALNQLSAANGHHEFEHLARKLARETVSRNILPATGPVAAGGDQGRDFETFQSELAAQAREVGRSFGVTDTSRIAFACTLQQDDVPTKVISDVQTIVSQGEPVDFIVYYCEANIPIAKRHELQARVQDDHSIHLEIFDGAGISELLEQRHLFWIAEEYLHLPASARPSLPERPECMSQIFNDGANQIARQ